MLSFLLLFFLYLSLVAAVARCSPWPFLVEDVPVVLVEEVAAAKSHSFVLAFVLSLLVPCGCRPSLLQRAVLSLS